MGRPGRSRARTSVSTSTSAPEPEHADVLALDAADQAIDDVAAGSTLVLRSQHMGALGERDERDADLRLVVIDQGAPLARAWAAGVPTR